MIDRTRIDPEIVAIVVSLRDRFGAAGLADAAALITEEEARTKAVMENGLADLAEPSSA